MISGPYVCLSVCVLAYLKHVMSKCSVHVAVAQSSCDSSAIRYVLPVLWVGLTSCFHIMEQMSQNHRPHVLFVTFVGGTTGSKIAVCLCKL